MPPQKLFCYRLPDEVDPAEFQGFTVVIIDVLRATSTITNALANGAAKVIPCLTIEDALNTRVQLAPKQVELCGERQGAKIDGFDRGNSPEEYDPESVLDQTLVFTTTNGTRAMIHAEQADEILLASFLNLNSVVRYLEGKANVAILCSGTNRKRTLEDELLAGAIACCFECANCEINGTTRALQLQWKAELDDQGQPRDLFESLKKGQGGINLVKRGLEQDIKFCSQIDCLKVVCHYDPNQRAIRVSQPHSRSANPTP